MPNVNTASTSSSVRTQLDRDLDLLKSKVTAGLLNQQSEPYRGQDLSSLGFVENPLVPAPLSKTKRQRLSAAEIKVAEDTRGAASHLALESSQGNLARLRKHYATLQSTEDRRVYLAQAWAWSTHASSHKTFEEQTAEEKASHYTSRRKVTDEHLAAISDFQQTIRDLYLATIPIEAFTVEGAAAKSGIHGGLLGFITKHLNAVKRGGVYRTRKSKGSMTDSSIVIFRKAQGILRSVSNQIALRRLTSQKDLKLFLKDLPPELSYFNELHSEFVDLNASRLLSSLKGSRASAVTTGSKFGNLKVKGRSSPPVTLVVPASWCSLKMEGGRQYLHIRKVVRDQELVLLLSSPVPASYVEHGHVRLVSPLKGCDHPYIHFSIPVPLHTPNFNLDKLNSVIAIDAGSRNFLASHTLSGQVGIVGAMRRRQLKKLREKQDLAQSRADALQNSLLKAQQDRLSGHLKDIPAHIYRSYVSRTRSIIRSLRRKSRLLFLRHRNIVDSIHLEAINYLTRFDVIIVPIFEPHRMAKTLQPEFARELLNLRHGEFYERLKARCEITGSLMIRGFERLLPPPPTHTLTLSHTHTAGQPAPAPPVSKWDPRSKAAPSNALHATSPATGTYVPVSQFYSLPISFILSI